MKRTNLTLAVLLGCFAMALLPIASSMADVLDGSGDHLVIPDPNPGTPDMQIWQLSNIDVDGYDVSWTAPALAAWRGTFHATGPVPAGFDSPPGLTRMDFTTLPTGVLPAGTYFNFSDLDGGSGSESFTLQAFDNNNQPITAAWLDTMYGVDGSGSGAGGEPDLLDMPSWDFSNGIYTFQGNNEGGVNPNTLISLPSNMDIAFLEVNRSSQFAHMRLGAPVPTPASIALMGMGGLATLRRRRR